MTSCGIHGLIEKIFFFNHYYAINDTISDFDFFFHLSFIIFDRRKC